MEALVGRRGHRLQRFRVVAGDRPPGSPGALDVVLIGLWLGSVAGFAEVGGILALREIAGLISVQTLRMNWHFAWMIPLSYLILFGTVGVACGLVEWLSRGRIGFRLWAHVLSFLVALTLTLSIPRIHRVGFLVLTVGASYQLGRWIHVRRNGLRRLVRSTLPGLIVLSAVMSGSHWLIVSSAERRAIASLQDAEGEIPNILLIVLDTVRADAIFPAERTRDATPFLTGLAARGVRFDEARSTAPWTLPSHASLFTGRWPHDLKVSVGRPLGDAHLTLAEHLADSGYATGAFVGNTQNCNAWYGFDQGFARYEDFYENRSVNPLEFLRSSRAGSAFLMSGFGQWVVKSLMDPPRYRYRKTAAMINRDALAWIDKTPDHPFFVFLNYYDAHDPYEPPPGAPRPFSRPHLDASLSRTERTRDAYDDCLAYLDSQLERLFDELQRRDLMRRTAVIITADHGEGFGEHNLYGHGVSLYHQELHVPLLVLLPSGAGAGRRVRTPVSLRDIPATIADLARSNHGAPFQGRSLARCWSGEVDPSGHDAVLSEADPSHHLPSELDHAPINRGPMRAIVTDSHVYIRNGDGKEELYDLEADAHELVNKAGAGFHDPPLDHFRATLRRMLDEQAGQVAARGPET